MASTTARADCTGMGNGTSTMRAPDGPVTWRNWLRTAL